MNFDVPAFTVGEVVTLMSSNGVPAMTIEAVSDDVVSCVWMEKSGKVRRDNFPKACLKKSISADARIIFMPEPDCNEEGIAAFLRGDRSFGERH